jgi:hypothetical protein
MTIIMNLRIYNKREFEEYYLFGRQMPIKLQGVTCQKTIIFLVTAYLTLGNLLLGQRTTRKILCNRVIELPFFFVCFRSIAK